MKLKSNTEANTRLRWSVAKAKNSHVLNKTTNINTKFYISKKYYGEIFC